MSPPAGWTPPPATRWWPRCTTSRAPASPRRRWCTSPPGPAVACSTTWCCWAGAAAPVGGWGGVGWGGGRVQRGSVHGRVAWEQCRSADSALPTSSHPGPRSSPPHPPSAPAVFYGPVAEAQPYFEGLGFAFPLQQNPADTLMDVVSGALLRPGQVRVLVAGRGAGQRVGGCGESSGQLRAGTHLVPRTRACCCSATGCCEQPSTGGCIRRPAPPSCVMRGKRTAAGRLGLGRRRMVRQPRGRRCSPGGRAAPAFERQRAAAGERPAARPRRQGAAMAASCWVATRSGAAGGGASGRLAGRCVGCYCRTWAARMAG